MAVCQEFGMATDSDVIPSIASGFPGGIGNTGSVCGAVIGAVMGIGLKQGRAESMEQMLGNLAVSREFRRRFEAEMKTINCRELTGIDLTTEEGIKQLMTSGISQTVCFPSVAASYRLVVDLLNGH
jgi:C_GCAxxG_C_C family probable redox protein